MRRRPSFIHSAVIALFLCVAPLHAQQVLDRVLARVGADAIFDSDVKAAVGLGLVEVAGDGTANDEALQRVIDRHLALTEINRIPRTEPDPSDVEAEVTRMKMHAGANLAVLLESTGIAENRLELIARDTLRIRNYLTSRFPTVPVSEADAEEYFRTHPDQFRRDGAPMTFQEAADAARTAVARERREIRIAQWLNDRRRNVEVSVPTPR